jgi:hypothetical protein
VTLFAVAKFILFMICRRIQNDSVQALAKDHFNDVISNTGAVACGIIGKLTELVIFNAVLHVPVMSTAGLQNAINFRTGRPNVLQ